MGADVSRVRFDPLDDFAGVVLQQGRLLLDGDFNEYVAMLDRRLRAETCDLTSFGPDDRHQGVAWVPRRTPDAFQVSAAGGALTIGRGRMYVDGLLAENHGTGPVTFDPLLGEATRTADMPYDQQPHWPQPAPLPDGGPHLAYLDVWQREVTHIEDPALVEIAVGVDTTARTQTVWQVRLLEKVPSSTTCTTDDDDIPGWLDVISPSAGRLTTGTVTVDDKDDPCELPPSSGYRGLENQTYRVEIHDGGAPGTATFKWSRENASVVQPVAEMLSPTELRLAALGRDDKLDIGNDDWVEILDDRYELGRRPGVMRKVAIDAAKQTITFADPLPADLQVAGAEEVAARHLRARRWDQANVVRTGAGDVVVDLDTTGSSGVITVPTDPFDHVVLEHGIVVSFATAAGGTGRLRAGDHWVFAARTADTSVEGLIAAAPLGPHHHYARLAVVSFPGSEIDCRRKWPAEATDEQDCACTVCVTPAPNSITLQEAIEQVRGSGGTICLAAGVYELADGVTIEEARSVRVRGQGTATVLVARGTAIRIVRSFGIAIENLAIVSGSAGAAAIELSSVVATTLEDLAVLSYNADGGAGSAIRMDGVGLLVSLRRNILVGRNGIEGGDKERGVLAAGLRIEDNVIAGLRTGIDLGRRAMYLHACRLTGNDLLGGRTGAIVADGVVRPGGSLEIARNTIASDGPGIVAGCDAAIEANTIRARSAREPSGEGILIVPSALSTRPGSVRILGNRVHDRSGAAISLRTPVSTFTVKHNVLSEAGAGIVFADRGAAQQVAIENNELIDVATRDGSGRAAFGILVTRAGSAAIVGNSVVRFAQRDREADMRGAIAVVGCRNVRISGNIVEEAGPPEGFNGFAIGIAVFGPLRHALVTENSVRPTAIPQEDGRWAALLVQSAGAELMGLGPRTASLETGEGALVLNGKWAGFVAAQPDSATLSSNVLEGGGRMPTCLVRVRGDVIADSNHCTFVLGARSGVVLGGSSITASSNRITGDEAMLILKTVEDRYAAVGNLTSGGTCFGGPGQPLPDPWRSLNPTVS